MALMESLLHSWDSSSLDSHKLVLFFPLVGTGQAWQGLESPHLLDGRRALAVRISCIMLNADRNWYSKPDSEVKGNL
ncbi:hypothetical protein A54_106 [Septuagintavirus sv54]|uniref:Uncharacterized protein n=1 Tax=Escherichia phage A5-4 TaxID=2996162 RepID=A0AAE9TJB6_9CAUD|nr:hypothetical protein A54_106 [Escherichia phage A5-4]